jgi:hypothetical protein
MLEFHLIQQLGVGVALIESLSVTTLATAIDNGLGGEQALEKNGASTVATLMPGDLFALWTPALARLGSRQIVNACAPVHSTPLHYVSALPLR